MGPRLAAIGLVLALLGTACQVRPPLSLGPPGPTHGGSVTEALVGTAGILNPLFAHEDNARDIDGLVYEGLTTVNAEQEAVPLLASDWKVSSDGLTYTVDLRTDVRWADGQQFSSDDVLFTMSVLQDPTYDQPGGQFWRGIQVEQLGSWQVRFTLKAPSASFPEALRVGLISKHLFRSASPAAIVLDQHSTRLAVGTGPFLVEDISANRRVVTLKRNPFARHPPNLDRFVFRSYPTLEDAVAGVAKGEVDAVGGVQPPHLAMIGTRSDLAVMDVRTFGFTAAFFNLGPDTAQFFGAPAVRQALVQSIDRRKIVEQVLEGRADGAPGPIPPSDWAYSRAASAKFPYDPIAAAKTLDDAGWTFAPQGLVRSRGGHPFTFSLVAADAYPYRQVADALSQQLRQVGIDVKVELVSASTLVGRYMVGRHYQTALAAFNNGPDPDQYSLWHSGQPSDSLNFSSLPRQALIDKDLEDGRRTVDRKSRLSAYSDFQDLMADAAPAIFLYEPHYEYVLSKRVKGVRTNPVIDPLDRFQHVNEWYVTGRAA